MVVRSTQEWNLAYKCTASWKFRVLGTDWLNEWPRSKCHFSGSWNVEQRLLTIRFSPAIRFSLAIRFYKPTPGIWILEHKGGNHASKVGGQFRRGPIQAREAPEIWGRSPNRGRNPRKSRGGVRGGGSVSPSLGFFWNFDLQIVTSGVWWKGKSCQKMGVNKIGGGSWTLQPHWLRSCLSRL